MRKIQRAIISCSDKTDVVEIAQGLSDMGVELISTLGTHRALAAAGIESTEVVDYTGLRELLGGRLKTLHPKVHAGLLGVRDNKLHCDEMKTNEFEWVDLIVVNLKSVDEIIEECASNPEEVIDQLDIGGIAMIRSAAKNFRYVTVVVNRDRYAGILYDMRAHDGCVPFTTRYKLAQEAFSTTAKYDETLAGFLHDSEPPEE